MSSRHRRTHARATAGGVLLLALGTVAATVPGAAASTVGPARSDAADATPPRLASATLTTLASELPAATSSARRTTFTRAATRRTAVTGWRAGSYRATVTSVPARYAVTVAVSGPRQRPVAVQRLVGSRWRTSATLLTGRGRTRAFRVVLPIPAGVTSWRLVVLRSGTYAAAVTGVKRFTVVRRTAGTPTPTPSPTTSSPSPTTTPPTPSGTPIPTTPTPTPTTGPGEDAGSASHYSFIAGDPIASPSTAPRWDRCTTIRVTGDFTRATAGAGLDPAAEKARWLGVLAAVAGTTGHRFTWVDTAPGGGALDTGGDVVGLLPGTGAFATADIVLTYGSPTDAGPYLSGDLAGSVLGFGGPLYTYGGGTTLLRNVRGRVVIDYGDVTTFSLSAADLTSLYLHEFAHVMGLGHYLDDTQVMNPYLPNPAPEGYRRGDRTGLAALASQPCFTGQSIGAAARSVAEPGTAPRPDVTAAP